VSSALPTWLAAGCLLLAGCARIQPPPGAAPDSEAPWVIRSYPAPGQLEVPGDESFHFVFSEYVDRASTAGDVYLSPWHEGGFRFHWMGRRLRVRPRDPLPPDRTWLLELGTGCRDLAGNRLRAPLRIPFSTGRHLDSLSLRGRIVGSGEGSFAQVWAWPLADFPTRFFERAPYRTRPDDEGLYELQALPGRAFRVMAVEDDNRNGRWDFLDERAAPADRDWLPGDTLALSLRFSEQRLDSLSLRRAAALDPWHLALDAVLEPAFPLEWDYAPPAARARDSLRRTQLRLEDHEGRELEILDIDRRGARWLLACERFTGDSLRLILPAAGDTAEVRTAEDAPPGKLFGEDLRLRLPRDGRLRWTSERAARVDSGLACRLVLAADSQWIRPRVEGLFHFAWELSDTLGEAELQIPAGFFGGLDGSSWPDSLLRLRLRPPAEEPAPGAAEWSWNRSPGENPERWRVILSAGEFRRERNFSRTDRDDDLPEGSVNLALYHDRNASGSWDAGRISPFRAAESWYACPDTLRIISGWVQEGIRLTLPLEVP